MTYRNGRLIHIEFEEPCRTIRPRSEQSDMEMSRKISEWLRGRGIMDDLNKRIEFGKPKQPK